MKSRRALILGVHPYKSHLLGDIPGVAGDANALSQMLGERFEFDCVAKVGGWTSGQLRDFRAKFLEDAKGAEIVLFYFGGHGVRVDVQTYLVPATASVTRFADDFLDQCLQAEKLVHEFRRDLPTAKKIFIFDCCRNDAKRALEAAGGRAMSVASDRDKAIRADANEVILFTASLDQKAAELPPSEEDKPSGHFIRSLLPLLRDPDKPLFLDCLREASKRVALHTTGNQKPQLDHGEAFDDFSLHAEGSPYKSDEVLLSAMPFDRNITAIDVCGTSGRVAVASGQDKQEGEIRILGKRIRKEPLRSVRLGSKPYSVVIAQDGTKVIFGLSNGQIGSFQIDDRAEPLTRQISAAPINSIDWARSFGWIVACSSSGVAHLLDAVTLTELGRCKHWSSVWCSSFHPEGDYLVTGAKDGQLRLWKIGVGEFRNGVYEHSVVHKPVGFAGGVRSLRFSHSGRQLAVGSEDGRISIFHFDSASGELALHLSWEIPRADRVDNRKTLLPRITAQLEYEKSKSAKGRLGLLKQGPSKVPTAVLAVDFSPDEQVLACSTSLEGYLVFEAATGALVGGMSSYAKRTEDKWPRSNALRYGHRKLFAGVGRKLHVVSL